MEVNELIRELRNRGLQNGSTLGHHSGLYEVAADALEIQQKRIAELEKQRRWIPVTERLPEAFVSVLVNMPGEKPSPTVREGFISNNGVWHSAYFDRESDEVTHWMPLPEPPEGD